MRVLFAALALTFAAPAQAAPPTPLLWKAHTQAGTVYLLGAFHLLTADDYPLAPSVEAAYDDAEALLFEIDPAEMMAPETAATMQSMARFEDGRTLRSVLSPATEKKLAEFVGGEEALAASDPFEPWYIGMNLAITAMVKAGLDPSRGLDNHFMQRARTDEKPAAGLETVAEQLSALDRAPMAEQETMLAESLVPPEELRADIDTMHAAWRSGDVDAISKTIVGEMKDKTPRMFELLNRDRNALWLPKVEALLKSDDDHLVVVGAMHLIGPEGLVEQLRKRGVTVERVE